MPTMDVFTALADPTRRSIIELLARQGQIPAREIYAHFPVSAPAISQHLKILRQAKLVDVEKRAQQRLYRVNSNTMKELELWVHKFTREIQERYERLDELLQEQQQKSNEEVNNQDK